MSEANPASAGSSQAAPIPIDPDPRLPYPTLEYIRASFTSGRSIYTVQVVPSFPAKSSDPLSVYSVAQLYLPSISAGTAPHQDALFCLDNVAYSNHMRAGPTWPDVSSSIEAAWASLSNQTKGFACDTTLPECHNARAFCVSRLTEAATATIAQTFNSWLSGIPTLQNVRAENLPFLGSLTPQAFLDVRQMPKNCILNFGLGAPTSTAQVDQIQADLAGLSLAPEAMSDASRDVSEDQTEDMAEEAEPSAADSPVWVTIRSREGPNPFTGSKTPRMYRGRPKVPKAPW